MKHYTFAKPVHGSQEWLAARWKNEEGLARISASNAAAVHNEHPFLSGAQLAIELLNEEPPQAGTETRAMQRGNTLEEPIRDWAGKLRNDPLITPCIMYAYEEDGVRLVATIDAVNANKEVFEIKTKRGRWNGELPRYWYWQGVQQAICANVDKITWVVFDSDLDIQFYKQVVTSDEKQIHVSACRNFLAAIDMGIIPDNAEATYEDLSKLYSGDGSSTELNEEQAAKVVSYIAAQQYIKAMEKQADEIKADLCEVMKDSEYATVNGTVAVTWRSAKRTTLDSKKFEAEHPALAAKYKKQTTYRTFRVVEGE